MIPYIKTGDIYFNMFRSTLKRDNELNKVILDELKMQLDHLKDLNELQLVGVLNKVLGFRFLASRIDDGRIIFSDKAKGLLKSAKSIMEKGDVEAVFKFNKKLLAEIYPEEMKNIPVSYYVRNFVDGKKIYAFCALSICFFYWVHFKRGKFSAEFTLVMIWLSVLIMLVRSTIAKINGHKFRQYL
jgi:hypothetical protein